MTTNSPTSPSADARIDAAQPLYARHFGLVQAPFSIAPDPHYLYMSERHREALAHLLFGLQGGGGFVLLTGEIGSGKTTVCRCMLEQVPEHCKVAYIYNPKLTVAELLETVCDEFGIPRAEAGSTLKAQVDALNAWLLRTHAQGESAVLVIDEAQNLLPEVLEQLRLLTNLETNERKLLQIVLVGQPELREMVAGAGLEQLAQRVIARYHLEALSAEDTVRYIAHRLRVAGFNGPLPFDRRALKRVMHHARGVARRINLLCDRALLGAYAEGKSRVSAGIVDKAAREAFGATPQAAGRRRWHWGVVVLAAALAAFYLLRSPFARVERPAVAHPAAPAPQAAPLWLQAATLRAKLGEGSGEPAAWRELGSLWGLALPADDPCAAASDLGVRCFRDRAGNLGKIRQLDRPVILTLYDQNQKPLPVLMIGLGKQVALLRTPGGSAHRVALASLAPLWRGEFATLWRAPAGYSAATGDVAPGPDADRLAQRLSELARRSPEIAGHPTDSEPRTAVSAFQFAQGLKPDGKAGPITLMLLNRASGVAEPSLKPQS